jgi:alanine racemase
MERGYTSGQMAQIMGGELVGDPNRIVQDFQMDSRLIHWGNKTLFIAIETERRDGHQYANEAYQKGVRCFLVSKKLPLEDCSQVVVPNTITAIQDLAKFHREQFDIPVVAITGSNGKTIVKEWLNQLCAAHYKICRSPRSFNSQLGVPLSLLQLNESHTLAIIEVGISAPGEMKRLERIVQPTLGVLTNIGDSHLQNFQSSQHLEQEKLLLFQKSKSIVGVENLQESDLPFLTWGKRDGNNWLLSEVNVSGSYAHFTLNGLEYILPFSSPILVEDGINAICMALLLGIGSDQIQERCQEWSALEMRMEHLEGINGTVIINDSYSFEVASLRLALDEIKDQYANRNLIVILSELPKGNDSEGDYKKAIELLEMHKPKQMIFVGENWRMFLESAHLNGVIYSTTSSFLQQCDTNDWKGEVVLVKGARVFGFETIIQRLQAQNHVTCLEVNLDAIKHNLEFFRSRLSPHVKTMVMVKAFGYGSGSVEVAEWLEFHQVDYLGVAYLDEGVALRNAGVSLPIMVMNPEGYSVKALVQYRLEPEVFSLHVLKTLIEEKLKWGIEESMVVHLKMDTGMHRLGIELKDLPEILFLLDQNPTMHVGSVLTHLSSAENVEMDPFTTSQLQQFDQAVAMVRHKHPHVMVHAANTAAIVRWPQAQYDMVRLGIGLYGYSPIEQEQASLQGVHIWKTYISQLRTIAAGDYVGYGCSFRSDVETKIATLPVGYADGFRRSLSNGIGAVHINGNMAPVIGRVCMDMIMVNVTGIRCQEGDEVELLGPHITLQDWARKCQTIPYEILTSISNRVKRKYIKS